MIMTNIHPILMKSEFSVPRILEGQKTQTRRDSNLKEINKNPDDWELIETTNYVSWQTQPPIYYKAAVFQHKDGDKMVRLCPFGDRDHWLWVRETFMEDWDPGMMNNFVMYKADHPDHPTSKSNPWKPSIHMPKKHARLWLKVENIGIEKLGSISTEDCIREGIEYKSDNKSETNIFRNYLQNNYESSPYNSFLSLWQHLFNQDPLQPDISNKWVWVISFTPYESRKPFDKNSEVVKRGALREVIPF